MAQEIDNIYEEAVASGLLPGASLIAGDKDGKVFRLDGSFNTVLT